MSVQSATDSILASKFTQLPSCDEDLIAQGEELRADAARVLAEAEAEIELGEELPLDGLELSTGEAEESVEADEVEPGQAAGSGADADDFAVEEGQEAMASAESVGTDSELSELVPGEQGGSSEAPESGELEAEELELDEEFFDAEAESLPGIPKSEPASGSRSVRRRPHLPVYYKLRP